MDFTGKVVLITGASSGIGAGTAEYFAKYGATLALVGRNVNNLEEVARRCVENGAAVEPLTIVADVTKDNQRIIDETIKRFGRLDVLVNNVGIGVRGEIATSTLEDYDRVMLTNVRSIVEVTTLAVPHIIKTKGNIVNVSSFTGIRSLEWILIYSMSKSALDQFTKCISLELAGKGVRVNSVNPALIVTNFHKTLGVKDDEYQAFLEHNKTTHPLGRVGLVEDVAAAIAFLASDAASFITGSLLPVDGGRTNLCPR